MALPRRLYPKELKINAVHLVQVEGRRACDVADELGIGRQTRYSWLHEARTGALSGTSENAHEITPQEAEIARLKSELARKEREIQLLKNSRRTSARPASSEVRLSFKNTARF